MKQFDVAIIGLGSMGSFAALELAKRKLSVIGFDKYSPPHEEGSHGGDTRAFRTVYTEHPNYVPLIKRSLQIWDRLAEEWDLPLLTRSGVISIGDPQSELIKGIVQSASVYNLELQKLNSVEIHKQFPALKPPEEFIGLIDCEAGLIDVPLAITNALKQARQLGADLRTNQPALEWTSNKGDIFIDTNQEKISAKKVLVTAGALTSKILASLDLPLVIRRQVLAWVKPYRSELFSPDCLPIFAFAPRGFYGFPNMGGGGVKIAHHERGDPLLGYPVKVPPVDEKDLNSLISDVSKFIPSLINPDQDPLKQIVRAKTCLYVMTPDGHCIIDRDPHNDEIIFATGFSGHGFKFSPVIAEALADLVTTEVTSLPIDFLSMKGRF
ncbi:MAG: N-methyl-L-tryptophan oxidase [Acidobacteriia bacterium]|jgi:sarcosine oxidase|nr:N-methyl-L-tryptophan oxidase [Terriglobia bacterium]